MTERQRKQKSENQREQQGQRSWRCTKMEKAQPKMVHGVPIVEQVHPLKELQPTDKPRASDFLVGMQSVKHPH